MVKEFKEVVFETLYAEPSRNGLTKPRSVRGKGYKMINMGELFAYGRICNPPMDLVPLNENEIKNTQMQEGDLLFARQSLIASGAGKCSIVLKCPEITTFESHLIRVRLNKKISNPLFYYYYFSSPIGTEKTQSLVSQVAAAGIRGSELAKLNVHYIDLEYQDKIAKILSNYDDLIENNNKRIKILEEMAQKIYKEWFVDFKFPNHETTTFKQTELGEIPSDWEVCSLNDVANLITRGVTPQYEDGSKKYIINQKVNRGFCLDLSNLKELASDLVVPDEKYAKKCDILINSLGEGTIGRVHYYNDKNNYYAVDQHMTICRLKEFLSEYVYLYLASSDGQARFAGLKTGATNMTMLNISLVRDFKIVVPKKTILQQFSKFIKSLFDLKIIIEYKNQTLKQTRDLLLPRLISGEIDVENMEIK